MKAVLLALTLALTTASAEELLKATDFTAGKGAWQGPGEIVALTPGDATSAVLRVKLVKNRWSVLEHRIRPGKAMSGAALRLELQSSADFTPLPESKEYAPEDFREGGEYKVPSRIFPETPLLIQLSDGGHWHYRPIALKASSGWQTITAKFSHLKPKGSETLAICLPPGEGSVDIKSVSLEEH